VDRFIAKTLLEIQREQRIHVGAMTAASNEVRDEIRPDVASRCSCLETEPSEPLKNAATNPLRNCIWNRAP
jgi:hypothetical protein